MMATYGAINNFITDWHDHLTNDLTTDDFLTRNFAGDLSKAWYRLKTRGQAAFVSKLLQNYANVEQARVKNTWK